jgi:hypothetical protein
MNATDAKQAVRDLIEAEVASGFPFLRRIPSTNTWRALEHVETITREERDVLFDLLAERGCGWLQAGLDMTAYVERQRELVRHPVLARYLNGCGQAPCWKYADPRLLRSCLDLRRQAAASSPTPIPPLDFGPVPLAAVEAAEPPVTAKAPEIRKAVKQAFTERFQVRPTNAGAGFWNYPGELRGRPFTLTLNWGTFMKLRYSVSVGRFPPNKPLQGVTWEGMLGFGIGHWDFVCHHNLAQSVGLLGEVVEKMVMLPE